MLSPSHHYCEIRKCYWLWFCRSAHSGVCQGVCQLCNLLALTWDETHKVDAAAVSEQPQASAVNPSSVGRYKCLSLLPLVTESFSFHWTPLRNSVQGLQLSAFSLLLLMGIVDITHLSLTWWLWHILFCTHVKMCFSVGTDPRLVYALNYFLCFLSLYSSGHNHSSAWNASNQALSFPPSIPYLLSIPTLLLSYSHSGSLITEFTVARTVAALNACSFPFINHVLNLLNEDSQKYAIRKASHIFNASQYWASSRQPHTCLECV